MNQVTLSLPAPLDGPTGPADRIGFDIGWDHAHHGLVPPPELLLAGTPVLQGWMAGKAVFDRRTLATRHVTRQWLALRLLAWRRGIHFETLQINPHYLAQIQVPHCPVLRKALGGGATHADAVVIERLNRQAGYAAGNLATMSQQAASAGAELDVMAMVRRARAAEVGTPDDSGLDAGAWWRLAVLRSFATPLPFHEAARLPMAALPPARVRLLNAVQGLQALVTRLFEAPGWAARCRLLASLLPAHTLRQDFNLFVGAMAPRVLEAGHEPLLRRRALEDAWLQERVQRRWQHLALSLGPAGSESLLDRAVAAGLGGPLLQHEAAQAVEGWALATQGRSPAAAEAGQRLQPARSAPGAQRDRRLSHRQPLDDGLALHRVRPTTESSHPIAMLVDERDVVNPGAP